MLILPSIQSNELNGLTSIPQAKETKLLIIDLIDMVFFEMLVKWSSKSIIIMITRDSIVSKIRSFPL